MFRIALKANNGRFVRANDQGSVPGNDGGHLSADRDVPGLDEIFIVHPCNDGRIALQTQGNPDEQRPGRFWSAEGGGGGDLHANRARADDATAPDHLRTAIGQWEQFRPSGDLTAGGQVQLQSWDGVHFVCCEVLTEGAPLNCTRTEGRGWETFTVDIVEMDSVIGPVDDAPPLETRTGLVRGQGRRFVDDGGAFLPLLVSFFWALWGWKFDRDRTKANLLWVRQRGADAIRVFCDVDGMSWADRAVRADWPDFDSQLADLIDYCYDQLGLRVQLTIIAGGTGLDPLMVARKVAAVIQGRLHKVLYVEAANEAFANLQDDTVLREVVRIIRQVDPQLLVAPSTPHKVGDLGVVRDWLTRMGGNLATGHFDRSLGSDGPARQIRQTRDWWGLTSYPSSQGEPAGYRTSVAEQREPIWNAMQFAVGAMSGIAAYCQHTAGAGVRGGGRWDVGPWGERDAQGQERRPLASDRRSHNPREANFWEAADAEERWRALRAIKAILPADIVEWEKVNGHWAWHPLPADFFWPDGFPTGINRNYAVTRGGEFWIFPMHVKHAAVFWPRQDCEIQVYDPTSGVLIDTQSLQGSPVQEVHTDDKRWFLGAHTGTALPGHYTPNVGQHYALKGPEDGGLWGYIIHGQR